MTGLPSTFDSGGEEHFIQSLFPTKRASSAFYLHILCANDDVINLEHEKMLPLSIKKS